MLKCYSRSGGCTDLSARCRSSQGSPAGSSLLITYIKANAN